MQDYIAGLFAAIVIITCILNSIGLWYLRDDLQAIQHQLIQPSDVLVQCPDGQFAEGHTGELTIIKANS